MATREYMPGMDYGVGIDSLSGEIRGDGVIRSEPQDVTDATGQTIQFHLEHLQTTEDLQQSLNVSAEVDVSYGFAGGSARFDYAENCEMHSYSVYLMARVEVSNSFRQMRDIKLKPPAWELLANGRSDRFREQFGDVFVRGMATGGVLFGLLELRTTSEKHQRDVSASVEASGGLGSWEASGEFSSSVKKVTAKTDVQVRVFQQGGRDTTQPTQLEPMIAKAMAFPLGVAGDKCVPYEVLLQDYRSLELPPVPNWVDLQNAKELLQDLWLMRNQLRRKLNDVNYARIHQEQFVDLNMERLNKCAEDLGKCILTVTRAASRCISKPLEARWEDISIPEIPALQRKDGNPSPPFRLNRGAIRALAATRAGKKQPKQPLRIRFRPQ